MALRGLVSRTLIFACCWLPFSAFGEKFGQDGSDLVSRRCECDSVEFWLRKRTNGALKLLSYEEIVSNTPNAKQLSAKNDLNRSLRLWVPKHCELWSDSAFIILQKDDEINSQNIAKAFVEIWIKDNPSVNCMAATLKCKFNKTLCIGIGARTKAQSTQRKLLMYETNSNEETFAHQPYSILLSVVVFCSLVILIALCGKTEKNSQKSVAYDKDDDVVKIVSSEKVKSIQRTDKDDEDVIDIKVENPSNLNTDSNSNNAKQPVADIDFSLDTGKVQKHVGKASVDGAVFGKEKRGHSMGETSNKGGKEMEVREEKKEHWENGKIEMEKQKGSSLGKNADRVDEVQDGKKDRRKEEKKKEDKHKEKEMKHKDHTKDMRSKRSHTSPERPEPKSSMSKLRFSLKGSSGSSNAYDEPKVSKRDKTKSKKKIQRDCTQANSQSPFSGDRRSFMNRELPKRPSEEHDDPPACTYESADDNYESGDDNYEPVVRKGVPPRSPVTLNVPNIPPQGYDNDLGLYDSVEDTVEAKPQTGAGPDPIADDESDTYEAVNDMGSRPPPTSTPKHSTPTLGVYESVGGNYEELGMRRQRSFSEALPGSSTPKTDAERKTMSLGRDKRQENAPTPPPTEGIKHAKESQQFIDDIEPYTITMKKGDLIVQETSISAYPRPQIQGQEPELSPEEKDKLYTKVDKEKQKKDRMEAEMEDKAGGAGIIGGNEVNGEVGATASISAVSHDEHQYATVSRKKDTETTLQTKDSLNEEHQYETMPRKKDNESTLQKKDSFDETEDLQLYEEVETKKDNKNPVYV